MRGPGTLVVLGFIAVCAATAAINAAFAWAGLSIDRGGAHLAQAQSLPRGAARDVVLDQAQSLLKSGLSISGGDARAWDLLGETRWLQATTAQARGVSQTLLDDARAATVTAVRLAPDAQTALVRLAAIEGLTPQGEARAATLVGRSYELETSEDAPPDARRVIAAARVWGGARWRDPHGRSARGVSRGRERRSGRTQSDHRDRR